ncbi:hypothetical protein SAMN02745702_02531 [Desulfobaculum bizertense DSM 18034]|uniref:Uncharacterized protein n=1 Tax=Desulfobaculum bizertense DSM 18034 TaxID=1121442 RepID=A0A1T4WPW3_9BACT|nr:hypothetical protein SAMN02745702_02531 [Desulfobaculum bizertense DSM 18034]
MVWRGWGTRLCLVLCKGHRAGRGVVVLLGRCPKPCKGRCPLTPPKDEALGNPAIAQKIRLNGMKASLSSPSAVFFELVGVSRLRVLLPFSVALLFFLNACVQKENGGNARERERSRFRQPH